MTLCGETFKLTPISEHSLKFDLELLHEVGGKNPRKEFKVVAYGLTLDHAIQKVIAYNTYKKLGEEAALKQFLDAYKEESDKIKREFKQT